MIDLVRAQEILTAAAQQAPQQEPLTLLVSEIARERYLTISPINFMRGTYFGFVHFVDDHQCLVQYKTTGAIVLDLDEIPDGETPPLAGDQVLITTCHGLVKMTVKESTCHKVKVLRDAHNGPRMPRQ